jgi:chromosome segregation ATPase
VSPLATVICSNCGQTVKATAKYCKFCGSALSASAARVAPAAPPTASVYPSPRSVKAVTEVPADALAQLEARAELTRLASEEEQVVADLEKLEGELERGDRSIDELEKQISPLQKRVKALKTQKKQLESKVQGFLFEKAAKDRAHWSDRLEKLEELKESGKVRESVYGRLHNEYETSRNKADAEYQQQVLQAREWLALLKAQYTAARDELAVLEARRSVGEVKTADYEARKEKLENRSQTLGRQVEILENVLRSV